MSMLDDAIEIAKEAGKIAAEFFEKRNFEVEDKGGYTDNFLTDADVATQNYIHKEIKRRYPEHGFLGEEKDVNDVEKELVWVVDPIDGTRQFVRQETDWGVHIGITKNGKPSLGVCYFPLENELYYAEKGKGAFLNGKQIKVSDRTNDLRSTVSWRIGNDSKIKVLYDEAGLEPEICGSSGLKICRIASGIYDVALWKSDSVRDWDMCAPQVILEEAGGKATFTDGNDIEYLKYDGFDKSILVSNGSCHDIILNRLNKE